MEGAVPHAPRSVESPSMGTTRFFGFAFAFLVTLTFAACGDDEAPPGGVDPANDGGGDGGGPDSRPPTRAEFGLDTRPSNTTCKAPARPPSSAPVQWQQAFANLGVPTMIAQRPGDASRWYVARRGGLLTYFPSNAPPANASDMTTAANLATIAGTPGFTQAGEGGFLGLAFHPKFAQNGKVYVSFTATGGTGSMRSVIAELTSTNGGDSFGAYKTILVFDQPGDTNHKGGGITFGKDGYLYVSFGDGGGGDDTHVKGQTKDGFFSKVLRLDVDNPSGGKQYGIPAGNAFPNGGGAPETFAYGFRNPFRISVDRETNELWVGDVGQNKWEEIIQAKAGGNYGWPCREGKHDYITTTDNAQKCPSMSNLLDPVVEHEHVPNNSRSITGGVVYRGKAIPQFVGTYVYGDFEQQELWALSFDATTGAPKTTKLNDPNPVASWVSFAEDADGEIYAVALSQSTAWKLVPSAGGTPSTFPDLLSKTGCKDTANLVPYGVNAQLWSDGADKERFIALEDGAKIAVGPSGDFDFPNGTVLVKSFKLGGKYVETRLLVRHDDGGWAGYTYEWNDAQTDATLLLGSKTKEVGAQRWYFPSRSDCVRCHTEAAGRTLGLELGQQNGDFVYASTNRIANQLKTLEHIGMFASPLGGPVDQLAVIPAPEGSAPLQDRARAYLHSNCANCHRPQGGGGGPLDLQFTTALGAMNACNVDGDRGDLGVAAAKLIVPGDPSKSLVSLRSHALGANRMPPLASSVVDVAGLKVVDDWIASITACP